MGADERLLLKVDEALKLFSDENDRCYFGMEPGGDYYTGQNRWPQFDFELDLNAFRASVEVYQADFEQL